MLVSQSLPKDPVSAPVCSLLLHGGEQQKLGECQTSACGKLLTVVMVQQEWERVSHGTGMGYSTVAGFWIPDKAPLPPPKEAPARAALKGATASKLKMHTAAVSKGAKRLSGKPVSTKKHDSADRKPPQVNVISRLPILHSGISDFHDPTLGGGL